MGLEFFLIWLLIAIVSFIYLGNRIRHDLGPVQDRSFAAWGIGDGDPGILYHLMRPILWLAWSVAYDIFGDPPAIPKPPEPPPAPPPVRSLNFEHILSIQKKELELVHPHLPNFREALLDAFGIFLQKDYSPPSITSPDWEAKIDKANEHLLDDLTTFTTSIYKELPNAPNRIFGASLYHLIGVDHWGETFRALGRTFPKVHERFLHWASWGRTLSGSGHQRMKEYFNLGEIERNSPNHVRYILKEFGSLSDAVIPIGIPDEQRYKGTYIVAPPGKGKSTLLSAMLIRDLEKVSKGEAAVIVFDSKGDLTNHLKHMNVFATGQPLAGKIRLIEPSGSLAINPLDLGASITHTIDVMEYLFTSLMETEPTEKMLMVLRRLILAAKTIPGANLYTLRDMLITGWRQYEKFILTADEFTSSFFTNGQFDKDPDARMTANALLWRIDALLTRVDLLKSMFKARETKVKMDDLMNNPLVTVIDNRTAILGEAGTEFFSRIFIAMILAEATQRSRMDNKDKLPVFVYVDEANDVVARDTKIATILQKCRSHKIGMIFAHQSLSQIENARVRAALADCGVRMANTDDDARALAESFRWKPASLQQLRTGDFALYVTDYLSPALEVTVPNVPLSDTIKMSASEHEAIRQQMARLYYQDLPEAPPEPVLMAAEGDAPSPWPPKSEH